MAFISKEDYDEGTCLQCKIKSSGGIDIQRMLERLDTYLGKRDYANAERHLQYWLGEARALNDGRGETAVLNEQMGLYRKIGKKQEALAAVDSAMKTAEGTSTVTATTFLNAATVYKAFDMPEKALPLYRKAQSIYEAELEPDDTRLAGLYNNMALSLTSLGQFKEAYYCYEKALVIMRKDEKGKLECAITLLNIAETAEEEKGLEAAEGYITEKLNEAYALIDSPDVARDGYYAFVCEKCAGVFGYHGFFAREKELCERAEKIYEGN